MQWLVLIRMNMYPVNQIILTILKLTKDKREQRVPSKQVLKITQRNKKQVFLKNSNKSLVANKNNRKNTIKTNKTIQNKQKNY